MFRALIFIEIRNFFIYFSFDISHQIWKYSRLKTRMRIAWKLHRDDAVRKDKQKSSNGFTFVQIFSLVHPLTIICRVVFMCCLAGVARPFIKNLSLCHWWSFKLWRATNDFFLATIQIGFFYLAATFHRLLPSMWSLSALPVFMSNINKASLSSAMIKLLKHRMNSPPASVLKQSSVSIQLHCRWLLSPS